MSNGAATGQPRLYDAFLSYSHAADGRLAPAVQRGLQRLTRPWYRRPALRVFRDQASLAANPDLWGNIERALGSSRYFVLLASPEAAASPWVGREVRYWQQHHSQRTFLIALTDGAIEWDDGGGDFDWEHTTALPPQLRGWFAAEPLWADLTWARSQTDLSLRHTRFREAIRDLAAPIHGKPKEELDSEDVRQQRRAALLGRGIAAVLAVLLVVASAAGVIANQARAAAQHQQRIAEQQRELATVRALQAEAPNLSPTAPQTSLRLSLAALSIRPTATARAGLVSTLTRSRYLGSSPPEAGPYSGLGVARLSHSGSVLAETSTAGSGVTLWNVSDPLRPARLARLPGRGMVQDLAFSPDDQRLAVASRNNTVTLWSLASRPRRLTTLTGISSTLGQKGTVSDGVAFSPGGTTLATGGSPGGGGTISLWDVADPARPHRVFTQNGVHDSESLAFSPDGRVLVTGSGTITGTSQTLTPGSITHRTGADLWRVGRDRLTRLRHLSIWNEPIAISPDSHLLALCDSSNVRLWDIADPARPRPVATLTGHTDDVTTMEFSPDGRTLAAGGLDDTTILWDVADPAHITKTAVLADSNQPIDAVGFAQDGENLVTVDDNLKVTRWRAGTAQPAPAAVLTGHLGAVTAVAISPDSRLAATASVDQSVMLYDITDPARPRRVAILTGYRAQVTSVAFSPDGSVLATGSWDRTIRLWRVTGPARPRLAATIHCPDAVNWLEFTSRGPALLAAAGTPANNYFVRGWARLWRVSPSGRPARLATFPGTGGLGTLALSPDGRTLTLSPYSAGEALVWDLSDPSGPRQVAFVRHPLPGQADIAGDLNGPVTFSPDGRTVATADSGNDGSAVLWDFADPSRPRQTAVLRGHTESIEQIGFHPGGRLVAAASDDSTTIIWDIAARAEPFQVATLRGHTDLVSSAVFSPDGRLLVDGSDDRTAIVWNLGVLPQVAADPTGLACRIAGGGFSLAQWRHWAPGIGYRATCPAGS